MNVLLLLLHHYYLLIAILFHEIGSVATFAPSQSRGPRPSRQIGNVMNTNSPSTEKDEKSMIRWGIIGLGDVCAIKSGPAFYKCRGSTLVAVMRRTPGAAKRWIEENKSNLPKDVAKDMRAFDSVERMVDESELDAIYIASPPGAHLENVRQIAKAADNTSKQQIKAVYVEKPCGRCAWETRAMIDELLQVHQPFSTRSHRRRRIRKNVHILHNFDGGSVMGGD